MEDLTLFHFGPSFYSQIVRLVLIEKGLTWKEKSINIGPLLENYEPWYIRINPRGVVPTLMHGETIVTDAFRIMRYVEEHFPDPSLLLSETNERQKMEVWIEKLEKFPERELSYGMRKSGWKGKMIETLMRFSFTRRKNILTSHLSKNPDLAEHYKFRLHDLEQWQSISTNPKEIEKLEFQQIAFLDHLEEELQHGSAWIMGEEYCQLDLVWTVFLARLEQFGRSDLWKKEERPCISAYYRRLKSRSSFKKADIWTQIRPKEMALMVMPFLLPRLIGLLCVLGLMGVLVWCLCFMFFS